MTLSDMYWDEINRSAMISRDCRKGRGRKREMRAHKWDMHIGVWLGNLNFNLLFVSKCTFTTLLLSKPVVTPWDYTVRVG